MHRLFVALRPPPEIRAMLDDLMEGVPGARWQDDDQLHLTLRYIGEVERPLAEDVVAALAQVRAEAIDARLAGVGAFDKRGRVDTLWAGATPAEPLAALHRKVDRALVRVGLPPERRAFVPHVTLARLSRGAGAGEAITRWLVRHADFASPAFRFEHLVLFESRLGAGSSEYTAVMRWPLQRGGEPADRE